MGVREETGNRWPRVGIVLKQASRRSCHFLSAGSLAVFRGPEATSGTLLEVSMLRHQDMALLEPCSIRANQCHTRRHSGAPRLHPEVFRGAIQNIDP